MLAGGLDCDRVAGCGPPQSARERGGMQYGRGQCHPSSMFFGDGGFNQGTTLKAMNLASAWKLPAVFVLEDNGYAESTASSWSIGGCDPIKRAAGFGLVGRSVDGHDFFAAYQTARELIDYARAGNGPSFLHVKFTRYLPEPLLHFCMIALRPSIARFPRRSQI